MRLSALLSVIRMINLESQLDLTGKVAVVTGGLGQLGREFVFALRHQGAKVAIIDNGSDRSGKTKTRIYRADISDKHQLKLALRRIVKELGDPTILVNCAAIDYPPKAGPSPSGLLETDDAESAFDRVLNVNLKGTILASQVFGNHMAAVGNGGSIINISSIYGEVSPDQRIYIRGGKQLFLKPISYVASKAAIPNVTRYLAAYYAKHNIRVNCVTFGGVFNGQNEEFIRKYCERVPMGRMADRNEYTAIISFLASRASSYMTGANVVMDGGYTIL